MGVLFFLILAGIFPIQEAFSAYSGEAGNADHMISVGGGIASPSKTSALGENPAGLVYNTDQRVLGALGATNSSLNPLGVGGSFFAGNGSVGGGIGLQTFTGQGNSAGNITLLNYGLAAEIESLNVAFGAMGTYTLNQTGITTGTGSGGAWNANLGMLYNPKGTVRVGGTLFQVVGGVGAVGAGIAADANPWATFVLDGAYDPQSKGSTLKPGLGIHMDDFQLSYGYGINIQGSDGWIRQGSSVGLGIQLSQTVHLQGYYNQLALYYLGLSVRI